ncbi:hypothetical protein D5086_029722 [Populus alba]|uniref:Uncharacterized protein n=1 Tax=Populus alba TaxID=43335 RepID=A0ACC4AUE7_POPAL
MFGTLFSSVCQPPIHRLQHGTASQPENGEATTMAMHSDLSYGKVTMHGSFVDFSSSIVPRSEALTR